MVKFKYKFEMLLMPNEEMCWGTFPSILPFLFCMNIARSGQKYKVLQILRGQVELGGYKFHFYIQLEWITKHCIKYCILPVQLTQIVLTVSAHSH